MTKRDMSWFLAGQGTQLAMRILGHRLTHRAFRLHEARISGQR
jgi:hypothetical protein